METKSETEKMDCNCKFHCSLCGMHTTLKRKPSEWVTVARGRHVCGTCQYMAKYPEVSARLGK